MAEAAAPLAPAPPAPAPPAGDHLQDEEEDDDEGRGFSRLSRLTTTLSAAHRYTLRGTTPLVILAGFGRRLRTTAGGIGCGTQAPDDFHCSFPVEKLDIFLSHSWRASWRVKYTMLLLHFNGTAALVAGICSGALCLVLHRVASDHDQAVESVWICRGAAPSLLALPVGNLAFLVTLLFWQNVVSVLRLRAYSVFLDKICISQTNDRAKEDGIKNIGGFLKNTEEVLVAWDKTYFSRLWCTYELSAYRYANPHGRLRVVPIKLGGLVLSGHVLFSVSHMLDDVLMWWIHPEETWKEWATNIAFYGVQFVFFLLFMPWIRQYKRELVKLDDQLSNFNARKSSCFCCDNGHLHPESGATLLCDRKLVYGFIASHYGRGAGGVEDEAKGLDAFDRLVRGTFKRDMKGALGRLSMIPYKHALMLCLPLFLVRVDQYVACPAFDVLAASFECFLVRYPLYIATGLRLVHFGAKEQRTRFSDRFLDLCLAVFMVCGCCLLEMLLERFRPSAEFPAIVVLEAIAVGCIYRAPSLERGGDKTAEDVNPERHQHWASLLMSARASLSGAGGTAALAQSGGSRDESGLGGLQLAERSSIAAARPGRSANVS